MWKQGEQKVCIDCKVLLTEDNWPKALQKSYHYRCRDCFNKGGKAWKKNNRAKITQRERERMASDPVYLEHKRKLARDCHNRHREAYNQKSKEHYYKHTADSKERNKIWKAKHGKFCVVGPSPYVRKWYAEVTMENNLIKSVK